MGLKAPRSTMLTPEEEAIAVAFRTPAATACAVVYGYR